MISFECKITLSKHGYGLYLSSKIVGLPIYCITWVTQVNCYNWSLSVEIYNANCYLKLFSTWVVFVWSIEELQE